MAIAVQDLNLVKRKIFAYFGGTNGDVFTLALIKAFFSYMSQTGNNPDLQFLAFDGTDVTSTTGKALADAACTLYAVYGKKPATATDAYLVVYDDPVDDCDGATDARLSIGFLIASDREFFVNVRGIPMAAGVVAVSYTDFDGTTKSSASDAPSGFVIIGAA